MKVFFYIFVTIAFTSCSYDSSKSKMDTLDEFFEILNENSIMVDSSKIDEIKEWAYNEAKISKEVSHQYKTINNIFRKIGDEHSVILSPSDVWDLYHNPRQEDFIDNFTFEGYLRPDRIAYLKMDGAMHSTNEKAFNYSDSLQSLIKSLDIENPKGWILDLRENDGGEFSSMLVGIGPLLGNNAGIYLLDKKEKKISFFYRDGHTVIDSIESEISIADPYELIHKEKPIAILVGPKTSSSGEALVVSFRGKDNVKIFGKVTCGLTTGMTIFKLKNGAVMNLATSYFMDKNDFVYKDKIQPDYYVKFKNAEIGSSKDSVIFEAINWIEQTYED